MMRCGRFGGRSGSVWVMRSTWKNSWRSFQVELRSVMVRHEKSLAIVSGSSGRAGGVNRLMRKNRRLTPRDAPEG